MPRAEVTQGLAETIRIIRLRNKIKSKELASLINKSAAYISKLEKGDIRSIDFDELNIILHYISKEESDIDLTEQIYKSLKIRYSDQEIERELWFYNYDTVKCLLPIPRELIQEINDSIKTFGISRQYLLLRINSNERLSESEKYDESIPFNQWYINNMEQPQAKSIKIKITETELNGILDMSIDVASYIFIFCIVFYLLKIKEYKEQVIISDEQYECLTKETTEKLNSYKFYSISEKNSLLSAEQTKEDAYNILNSFDKDNIAIINDIISGFHVASEQNIKAVNEQLQSFRENMHWDLGFMLKLISLNFNSLQKTNVSNKKELLSEIENLIKKYYSLQDVQNKLEIY